VESPLSFGTTYEEAAARADDEWRRQARELAETQDNAAFVAGQDGVIRVSRDEKQLGLFGIYSFWVAPDARGRGLAARLLQAAEVWARGNGGIRAELFVREAAHVARHVYERAGYAYDGRTETSLHGGAELGMTKEL
jgi:GNAT superfamily N-acetyltransferase